MKTDFELSRKIMETFKTVGGNYSSVFPEVLNLIGKDVFEKLEITNITKPFLMVVLEDICKDIKDSLDEESKMLYELIRLTVKTEVVCVAVPEKYMSSSSGGKGERDEEKRE